MRRFALLVLLPFVAGCAASDDSTFYAGMDGGEAPQGPRRGQPAARPQGQAGGTVRGETSEGEDAWVVRVRDLTAGDEFCVRVWADTAATVRQYSGEIDECRPAELSTATPS